MVANILNTVNNRISRLYIDENGDRCIALGQENIRNIASCLQNLLVSKQLNRSEISKRLKAEYNYRAYVIPSGCSAWGIGGAVYSVSKWNIKDQPQDIDDDIIIIIVWNTIH